MVDREQRRGLALGCATAVGIAIWMTHHAWGGRALSGEDTLGHVIRAQFALDHIFKHGHLDGWNPRFILGYQQFLFVGPGFTWGVLGLHLLTLGLLSTTGAVKVVGLACFAATPLAVAFVARTLGLSRRATGAAAVLTLAVNNPFGGVGPQGLFNVGLLTHQFAAVAFFVALGGAIRVARRPDERWLVITAIATAVVLVTHLISAVILGLFVAIVVPLALVPATPLVLGPGDSERAARDRTDPPVPRDVVLRLAVAFVYGAGIAAIALLPFAAHRNLHGGYTGWDTPSVGRRLGDIFRGDVLFRPGVALLVLIGMAYVLLLALRGRRGAWAVAFGGVACLVVSHALLHRWSNLATIQLPNRGLGYAGALAVLPLAFVISDATAWLRRGSVVAIAIAGAIVIVPLGPWRGYAKQTAEPVPALRAAAVELHRVVPAAARFATERDFPEEVGLTGGVVNPDRWLAWASGRNTLNTFVNEASTSGVGFEMDDVRIDRPTSSTTSSAASASPT